VDVDAASAYDQWARFESYSLWMEGVVSITRTEDGRLHWVARVKSQVAAVEDETREWDARVVEETRDRRISWESIPSGPGEKPNSGRVTFEPLGPRACRVTFRMEWEPEAALQAEESYVLSAVGQVVAADLERFKTLIEAPGRKAGSRPR
jgi:uncharacterized membrane protein